MIRTQNIKKIIIMKERTIINYIIKDNNKTIKYFFITICIFAFIFVCFILFKIDLKYYSYVGFFFICFVLYVIILSEIIKELKLQLNKIKIYFTKKTINKDL